MTDYCGFLSKAEDISYIKSDNLLVSLLNRRTAWLWSRQVEIFTKISRDAICVRTEKQKVEWHLIKLMC